MQFRTEVDVWKLLKVWDGRESAKLHFKEIQSTLGWNNRKTANMLKRAVEQGYLERVTNESNKASYRCRLADYSGYFNALDFINSASKTCTKNGLVQSSDYRLVDWFHIVAYGLPKTEELTPLEKEILYVAIGRMGSGFNLYTKLSYAVKERMLYEKERKLSSEFTGRLFDGGEIEEVIPKANLAAACGAYGDLIWELVFNKIVDDIRFAVVHGSLDLTGPMELMAIRRSIVNHTLNLGKRIYRGEFSAYREKTKEAISDWKTYSASRPGPFVKSYIDSGNDSENPSECPTYGVVLTPSPENIDKFHGQVGRIIEKCYNSWSGNPFGSGSPPEKKGGSLWEDEFRIRDGFKSRKELFRAILIQDIFVERENKQEVISSLDEKLMVEDQRLLKVFTRDEIREIIKFTRSLGARIKKFRHMIDENASLHDVSNDPEWFTEEELESFRVARNVIDYAREREWERAPTRKGNKYEFLTVDNEEFEKTVRKYLRWVRNELGGKTK